jgi:hypothetical protein
MSWGWIHLGGNSRLSWVAVADLHPIKSNLICHMRRIQQLNAYLQALNEQCSFKKIPKKVRDRYEDFTCRLSLSAGLRSST